MCNALPSIQSFYGQFNLRLREGGRSSQSSPVMKIGQLPTNQLHDINNYYCGALDHASH